ncbi:hypothetical protein BGZ83_002350 [Gryganskiella cystojenkinii]|nr:hypothetical protein BGZ83_002350 [Gryganskiella cystojenkinii]
MKDDPAGPPLRLVSKYQDHIRKMILYSNGGCRSSLQALQCSKLSELTVGIWRARLDQNAVCSLILTHQHTLQKLTVKTEYRSQILDAISSCSRLEQLEFAGLTPEALEEWRAATHTLWSHVRFFSWSTGYPETPDNLGSQRLSSQELSDILEQVKETSVQELSMTVTTFQWYLVQAQWLLIVKSPHLARLHWMVNCNCTTEHPVVKLLADAARSYTMIGQRLFDLSLPRSTFRNQDFADLVRVLPVLTKLNLNRTNFDVETWKILKQETPELLTMLRSLKIRRCNDTSGAVVQDILCSMPNLEEFWGDYLSDSEILEDDRPWVCLSLKTLALAIILLQDRDTTQPLILDRLSRLERLEVLNLDNRGMRGHYGHHIHARKSKIDQHHCLLINLAQGLEPLRTLRCLTRIHGPIFWFSSLWTAHGEMQWVLEHWRRLATIRNFVLDDKAKKLWEDHRLQLKRLKASMSISVEDEDYSDPDPESDIESNPGSPSPLSSPGEPFLDDGPSYSPSWGSDLDP